MKICIICSSGGHLLKSHYLKPWWGKHDRFWVTKNDLFSTSLLELEKTYWGYFPEQRNILNFFRNLVLAIKILTKERPDVLFSTGAGIAPPFFIIAKLLGIKTIFMETFIFIPKATLSGRMLYHFSDLFIVQHPDLLKKYSKAKYLGSVV
jgi:beta-1,4-N-acetylglucosaminyltransferase